MGEAGKDWEFDLESLISKESLNSSKYFETEISFDGEDLVSEESEDVERTYNFEEYRDHVNMSCIGPQEDDVNPSSTPFESLMAKMTPVTDDGGVMKQVLKRGTSRVLEDGTVDIHYNSYFEMNEIPFDSSYMRQEKPERLNLKTSETYPGFSIAVRSMCLGEKSNFLISPQYAFGEMGCPPRIPPAATILVQIEVLNCQVNKGDDEKEDMEDLKKFEVAYEKAAQSVVAGKDLFSKDLKAAVREYRTAARFLESARLTSDDDQAKWQRLLARVRINLMTCYNLLGKYECACVQAHEAAYKIPEVVKDCPKFFYQLAKSHLGLGAFDKALKNISRASTLLPSNPDIRILYEKIKGQKKTSDLAEKIMYSKALGLDALETSMKDVKIEMTEEDVKRFTRSAEKIISSCCNSREPVNFDHKLTDEEWTIFNKLCKQRGVKLEEEFISGIKTRRLVRGNFE